MRKPKVGLLPFYLKLYDDTAPQNRVNVEKFYNTISDKLEEAGVEVKKTHICRLSSEFEKSVGEFENWQADAIVTLHLAYSPSLESIKALKNTKLPVIVLDTTPDYEFGPDQEIASIAYNHGIHGVQDMCNMLIREGKEFRIEAGHWEKSDVIQRVKVWADAAYMCNAVEQMKIGRIGEPFKGMGDFAVPDDKLHETLGIKAVNVTPEVMTPYIEQVTEKEIEEEIQKDKETFITKDLDKEVYVRSLRIGLGVRKWLEEEKLSGFTVNFLNINKNSKMNVVPFLEASKAISRGLGYGGEGDVLTAGLVAALAKVYEETTFTEMFCPDWKGNRVFLNHMGEMNVKLSADKPVLREKPFPYTDAYNPVVATACYKQGKAVLVNLAPGPNDSYRLIIVPLTMVEPEDVDNMQEVVRGWFSTQLNISEVLKKYSEYGGTHHSAMVYGDVEDGIVKFGQMMGWDVFVIK